MLCFHCGYRYFNANKGKFLLKKIFSICIAIFLYSNINTLFILFFVFSGFFQMIDLETLVPFIICAINFLLLSIKSVLAVYYIIQVNKYSSEALDLSKISLN